MRPTSQNARRRAARAEHPVLAALLLLVASTASAQTVKQYGVAAGPAFPLAPTNSVGAALAVSAAALAGEELAANLLRARGELHGIWTSEAKALMPTLIGEAGLNWRRLDLFLTGGVQLFGVAQREGYTVFATFGLLGGGGLALHVHRRVSITMRGLVSWLPSFATAILSEPSSGEKPSFAFFSGLVGVDISTGSEEEPGVD